MTGHPRPGSLPPGPPRYAARCRFVQVTLGSNPGGHLVNLCRHVVRDGMECVGPFLDDTETTCGLWEFGARVHEPPPRP